MTTAKGFFSQTDNISKVIADEILAAKEYVLLAMYTLTDLQMIDALKKARANQIEVLLIFDQKQMHNNQPIFFTLNNAGLTFRTLEIENASMHHKFIVIDDITTITGSFNWTYSAQKKNYENILLIKDAAVAEQYKREFDRIWQRITSKPIDDILKQKERLEAKLQEERLKRDRQEQQEQEEKLRKEQQEREEKLKRERTSIDLAIDSRAANAIRIQIEQRKNNERLKDQKERYQRLMEQKDKGQ